MSDYYGPAINPLTQEVEHAHFIDDFYGQHQYGVQFADGRTYHENLIAIPDEGVLKDDGEEVT